MKAPCQLLFILFLFPLFTLAQSNYKPGYVVTLKGDTLHGFIDYQEWDSNPAAVSFKAIINDKNRRSFAVTDISFFNVDGLAAYKKYTCSVSMDETNTSRLGTSRDTSSQIETVFLKILQKGKNVALYQYTDGLKTRFYIGETPDYSPTELVFRLYENVEANGTTVNENTYLKQLFALANKYNVLDDDLTRTLQSANYSQSALLPIVSKINNMSKAEYAKKYAERGKVNFYVSAALNITNTISNSSAVYTEDGGRPYTSYLPAASLGINFIPNPNTGRVEFLIDLTFAEAQFNSLYKLKVSPYVDVKAAFNQLAISLAPQVIYNIYNSDNFKFYVGVGISLNYNNYSNAVFQSQNPSVSVAYISESNPYDFNKVDDTYLFKAGVKFNKKWGFFVNYLTSAATTRGGYYELSRTIEQIGAIYLFGK